jgi:SAM-dependent methyltransferase
VSYRDTCRSCGSSRLLPVMNLGVHPLSNAFLSELNSGGVKIYDLHYPLLVVRCENCTLVQLGYDVPREGHFNPQYAYHSSANSAAHWERLATQLLLNKPRTVLEVASNDGYLLKYFAAAGCAVRGVEPSANVAQIARDQGIPTDVAFFGKDYRAPWATGADLVLANNVFAHMPDPNELAVAIEANLAQHGVAVLEFPSVLQMLQTGCFDTIYHEHYSYWSLEAAEHLFRRHGLRINRAHAVDIHGGSYRIFVSRGESEPAYRGTDAPNLYRDFEAVARRTRGALTRFIGHALLDGKTVAAYGAAAKGNTLLNYCGLTRREITCIADTTPSKQGKWAPGSHIPVVSPEAMLATNPDYVLLLAWNWKDAILPQLQGHKVIVPIPEVKVIEP